MATVQEVQASVDALSAAVEAAKQRIAEDVAALEAQIGQLGLDQEALAGVQAAVDALKADVDTIDPVPPEGPVEGV